MASDEQRIPVRRALLSVSDKTGLEAFAQALHARGVMLISTGGTARALAAVGLPVTDVAEVTGWPEMMDGRVKTLHPKVHGGLLARRDDQGDRAAMEAHGIAPIDLLVVNFYPFEETVARGATRDEMVENIDIGGPAMIRASAKNHAFTVVVTDPADYAALLDALETHEGATTLSLRRRLAAKAFQRTASYDAAIAASLGAEQGETFPERLTLAGRLAQRLRYGENPHQEAAFYAAAPARPGVATARQVQGKELSYNNLNDTDAAYECVAEFDRNRPAIVIVKHANPCGVATAETLRDAYAQALRCDPVSAFGGIVALNQRLDAATAQAIAEIFTEVVIAPDAEAEALALLASKKNLRVLLAGALPAADAAGLVVKSLAGGLLAQTRDTGRITAGDLKVVTKRRPSDQEFADLLFAFRVAKHVKSNAIVYAKDGATVGIGAGQMSRVDAAMIAARKAENAARAAGLAETLTKGAAAASDAFFPFADGVEVLAQAGATAVIQPGGSVRDEEVIAAADAAGLAMVFTGMRHFRH
jgi:phosphoribosylaminoimidazolecarboxamide formyltransferase/IMP cyclohydrolase